MRTRLGLQVLKDTKHLSVRTRRGIWSRGTSLLDGPALQLRREADHGGLLLHGEVVDGLYGRGLSVGEGLLDRDLGSEAHHLGLQVHALQRHRHAVASLVPVAEAARAPVAERHLVWRSRLEVGASNISSEFSVQGYVGYYTSSQ